MGREQERGIGEFVLGFKELMVRKRHNLGVKKVRWSLNGMHFLTRYENHLTIEPVERTDVFIFSI
jgi:hypothetical protein